MSYIIVVMARLWGKDPGKSGGRDRTPPSYEHEDKGARTCGRCGGTGEVETETAREDPDNGEIFTEYLRAKCTTCKGAGTI
jgi:DnaJ-class molecular chaperone